MSEHLNVAHPGDWGTLQLVKGGRQVLIGVAVAALSCLAFPLLLQAFAREALSVQYVAPDIAAGPQLEVTYQSNAPMLVNGELPWPNLPSGLHLLHWQHRYRGGHHRNVGHTQLLGPFQDPVAPPCSVRLLVGPAFFPPLGEVVKTRVEGVLKEFDVWPLGNWESVDEISMRWQRLDSAQNDTAGYLEMQLQLQFSDAEVELEIHFTPAISQGELAFSVAVTADLDLNNPLYQFLSDLFNGNDRASEAIAKVLSAQLGQVLNRPPPIPLGGNHALELRFCDRPIEFHEQGFVAVPLAIVFDDITATAPPLSLEAGTQDVPMRTALAVEIDQNGLNGVLHVLWSSGVFDREIASRLVASFNTQETVRDFLTLRLENTHFHLPPTLHFGSGAEPLRLRAAAVAELSDSGTVPATNVPMQLFAEFRFGSEVLRTDGQKAENVPNMSIHTLAVSCVPKPGVLQACYSQIQDQLRANQQGLETALTEQFGGLLFKLFTGRQFGGPDTGGRFMLETLSFQIADHSLRAELHGQFGNTP